MSTCILAHMLLHVNTLHAMQVATAVAEEAFEEGVAQIEKPDDLEAYLADRMWLPSSPLDVPQHFSSLKTDKK